MRWLLVCEARYVHTSVHFQCFSWVRQTLSQDGRELEQLFPSYCLRFIGFVLRKRYDD